MSQPTKDETGSGWTRAEIDQYLDGICTEIGAGSVMIPKNDGDRAHNAANKRAVEIVKGYQRGRGIFQLPWKDVEP